MSESQSTSVVECIGIVPVIRTFSSPCSSLSGKNDDCTCPIVCWRASGFAMAMEKSDRVPPSI